MAQTAEIADGWLPIFLSPKTDPMYRAYLDEGFARPGARRTWDDFEIPNLVTMVIDDDVEKAADIVRMSLGFYIGGMGAREVNFHADVFSRMGYEAEVEQDPGPLPRGAQGRGHRLGAALARRGRGAGRSRDKVLGELEAWKETCITTLLVAGPPKFLEQAAGIVNG